ncbi:c-type cytochrome biogenesis protein CcmI [Alishewanella longhuensis]|uniref:C-type cytochrome biogenesis protein CcmI n=1 Tax=Alishewanella longhuensis TaxID=1091037 RepID=A0ABQ3KZU8_9ALTE|nr:c-type cytochrome biogenesis protein CcmI [Alishewanella longhuensis]GHG70507.1 c-type cytochrome biogenesis protein CcmI [Alishewanella longhuensis]
MIWQIVAGAAVMFALSALFIFWPRKASAQNHQTPAQLFEERLQLLVLARDAGELAEQDFSSAAAELKDQFLEQEQKAVLYQQPKHKVLFHSSLVVFVLVIVGVIYSQNGHYRELADWELAQQNLATYGQRALLGEGEPMNERDMQLFSLALRTKLDKEGDDAVAWMLLGRVWMTLGMLEESVESFERALKLMPERTPLLISYSQALIMLGGDYNLAKAGQSVAKVLMKEPDNIDAVSLMALIAHERGDNEQAISAWQLLASSLDADDPRLAVVAERLAELTGQTAAATAEVVAENERSITLTLSIADTLATDFPDASLFVFARAIGGPPLPLAAKRLPMQSGLVTINLSTADAMQPGWDLTQSEQIEVVARIAISGTVERSAQDVEVVSAPLRFEQPHLTLQLTLEP